MHHRGDPREFRGRGSEDVRLHGVRVDDVRREAFVCRREPRQHAQRAERGREREALALHRHHVAAERDDLDREPALS